MIAASTHRTAPFSQLSAQVQRELARLNTAFAKYRLFHRTVSELSALSNRDLADLGLCRSEIRSIAMETVYGA